MTTSSISMPEKDEAGKASIFDHFAEERRVQVREFLSEKADALQLTVSTLCNYLELRDDKGALYAIECMAAYARAIEKAATFLRNIKNEVKAEPQPA